jgi:hypothetical protein
MDCRTGGEAGHRRIAVFVMITTENLFPPIRIGCTQFA